jgi:hypothetical protein
VPLANAFNTILKFAIPFGQFRHHTICAMGGRTSPHPARIEANGLPDPEFVLAHGRGLAPHPAGQELQRLSRADDVSKGAQSLPDCAACGDRRGDPAGGSYDFRTALQSWMSVPSKAPLSSLDKKLPKDVCSLNHWHGWRARSGPEWQGLCLQHQTRTLRIGLKTSAQP